VPTLITHAMVGISAAAIASESVPARVWILAALCASIADADVLAFKLGIPYSHVFGHRGFSHSLFFALLLALAVVTVFFRNTRALSRSWFALMSFFFIVGATHPILDAVTNGGLGVALLAPFDNTRYFFPVTPIEVAPISLKEFLGEWGVQVLISEFMWVWMPTLLVVFLVRRHLRPAFSVSMES
jgi:inner membrane protein